MVVAELPWIAAETNALVALQQRRSAAHHPFPHGHLPLQQPSQPGAPPAAAGAPVGQSGGGGARFGLWDSEGRISRLQLTVALSMATDVDEARVHVTVEDSHFFSVEVDDAPWLVDAVNGEAGADFLGALNAQARAFDARLVVSHAAVRVDDGGAPPAAPAPISPAARAAGGVRRTAAGGDGGAP